LKQLIGYFKQLGPKSVKYILHIYGDNQCTVITVDNVSYICYCYVYILLNSTYQLIFAVLYLKYNTYYILYCIYRFNSSLVYVCKGGLKVFNFSKNVETHKFKFGTEVQELLAIQYYFKN